MGSCSPGIRQRLLEGDTEGASTPNIGRGAKTEPKTTMHSLTDTVRTLPPIAGLQAYGIDDPIDICTSPQDVRHMFVCNTYTPD